MQEISKRSSSMSHNNHRGVAVTTIALVAVISSSMSHSKNGNGWAVHGFSTTNTAALPSFHYHYQQQQQQQHVQRQATTTTSSSLNMFTGIIEEMGTVVALDERDDMVLWDGSKGEGTELTVKGDVVMEGAYLGCSISVSGVCLTATELDDANRTFKVGLAPETLRKTYLGTVQSGDRVNLERASEIGGRNSGHFVQGHVDDCGTIIEKWIDQDSLFLKIKVPPDVLKYIVPKGFIAVDGTSLTVCDVNNNTNNTTDPTESWFTLMLIEYTQKKIIVPAKLVGDKVNIEVDVLGKYSETAMAALLPRLEALEAKVASMEQELSASK